MILQTAINLCRNQIIKNRSVTSLTDNTIGLHILMAAGNICDLLKFPRYLYENNLLPDGNGRVSLHANIHGLISGTLTVNGLPLEELNRGEVKMLESVIGFPRAYYVSFATQIPELIIAPKPSKEIPISFEYYTNPHRINTLSDIGTLPLSSQIWNGAFPGSHNLVVYGGAMSYFKEGGHEPAAAELFRDDYDRLYSNLQLAVEGLEPIQQAKDIQREGARGA